MCIIKSLELLDELGKISVRFRPKTSYILKQSRLLSSEFKSLNSEERDLIRAKLDSQIGSKLLSLSGYLAEKAINTKDSSWIDAAITLQVIEDFGSDYRNNFRYLILIAYAGKKIRINFPTIINSILIFSSTRTKSYLTDFIERDDSLNNLSSVGLKSVEVEGETRFVSI